MKKSGMSREFGGRRPGVGVGRESEYMLPCMVTWEVRGAGDGAEIVGRY